MQMQKTEPGQEIPRQIRSKDCYNRRISHFNEARKTVVSSIDSEGFSDDSDFVSEESKSEYPEEL